MSGLGDTYSYFSIFNSELQRIVFICEKREIYSKVGKVWNYTRHLKLYSSCLTTVSMQIECYYWDWMQNAIVAISRKNEKNIFGYILRIFDEDSVLKMNTSKPLLIKDTF